MERRKFIQTASLAALGCSAFGADDNSTLSLHVVDDRPKKSRFSVDGMLSRLKPQQESTVVPAAQNDERFLWLVRRDTGEELREVFARNGEYVYESYKKFCWLMRDLHIGKEGFVGVDGNLMNILHRIQNTLIGFDIHKPILVHSGYRSATTNAKTEGAAKNSYHVKGKAIDISINDMDAQLTGTLGMIIAKGGVGFYPTKNFIHLDTGDIRYWVIDDSGRMNSAKNTVAAFR